MDYARTIGALLVGAFVVFVLYGFGSMQTYVYFHVYKNDSVWMRVTVLAIWFLHTLQISFLGNAVYHYAILSHGNPAALVKGYGGLYAAISFNLPIATTVQLYFTTRIYALASAKPEWGRLKYWLTGLVLFFVIVGHFGIGLCLSIQTIMLGRLDDLSNLRNYAIAVVAGHVASEMAISGALTYLFASSRTAYQRTNDVLTTLIVYAVNRSLLTSALTCASIAVFITKRGSLWSIALEFIVTSVHINTMLAALNCRQPLRDQVNRSAGADSHGMALSSRFSRPSALHSSRTRSMKLSWTGSGWPYETHVPVDIHVTVTKETCSDVDTTVEDVKLSRNPNSQDVGCAV